MTRLRAELTPRLAHAKLTPGTRQILEQAVGAAYAGDMRGAGAAANHLVQTGADFVEVRFVCTQNGSGIERGYDALSKCCQINVKVVRDFRTIEGFNIGEMYRMMNTIRE